MPLAKRMEKTPASPVTIKLEPVDSAETENLRATTDKLNGTIELSDDEYNPADYYNPAEPTCAGIVNLNSTSVGNQDEEGIILHPDTYDLAIDLDYEPAETDRGESILDEVTKFLTNSFLDNRRPFRTSRETDVNWFSELKSMAIDCDLEQLTYIILF